MSEDNCNVETIHFGGSPFRACEEMADDLWDEIMKFDGRVSLMETVGVLRLLEHKLLTTIHTDPDAGL